MCLENSVALRLPKQSPRDNQSLHRCHPPYFPSSLTFEALGKPKQVGVFVELGEDRARVRCKRLKDLRVT